MNRVRPLVDYELDRPQVYAPQGAQLSGTNGRGLDPCSGPPCTRRTVKSLSHSLFRGSPCGHRPSGILPEGPFVVLAVAADGDCGAALAREAWAMSASASLLDEAGSARVRRRRGPPPSA